MYWIYDILGSDDARALLRWEPMVLRVIYYRIESRIERGNA
jgi:hypothetical protein